MPRTGLKSKWKRGPETLLFCCTNSTGSKHRLEEIRFAPKKLQNFTSTSGLSYQPAASDGTQIELRTDMKQAPERTSFEFWGDMNNNREVTVHGTVIDDYCSPEQ